MIRFKFHLRVIRRIYSVFTQLEIDLRMIRRNRFYLRIIRRHYIIYACYTLFTNNIRMIPGQHRDAQDQRGQGTVRFHMQLQHATATFAVLVR